MTACSCFSCFAFSPESVERSGAGGLKDTVEPYNEFEGTGTGFSFCNYNAHEMLSTVRYAEQIFYDKKREWNKMVDRAMAKDFSWGSSARQYEEMYNWLIGE